jgi:hypothetical protein
MRGGALPVMDTNSSHHCQFHCPTGARANCPDQSSVTTVSSILASSREVGENINAYGTTWLGPIGSSPRSASAGEQRYHKFRCDCNDDVDKHRQTKQEGHALNHCGDHGPVFPDDSTQPSAVRPAIGEFGGCHGVSPLKSGYDALGSPSRGPGTGPSLGLGSLWPCRNRPTG